MRRFWGMVWCRSSFSIAKKLGIDAMPHSKRVVSCRSRFASTLSFKSRGQSEQRGRREGAFRGFRFNLRVDVVLVPGPQQKPEQEFVRDLKTIRISWCGACPDNISSSAFGYSFLARFGLPHASGSHLVTYPQYVCS
jgi:hypothetical protein